MATAADDFDRANNATIGVNWTQDSGSFGIDTNAAEQVTSGGAYRQARYTATPPDTNDMRSTAILQSADATRGRGTGVRQAAGAVTSYQHLGFGGDNFYLVRTAAGVENILATGRAMTASTNYTVETRATGTTIEGYVDSTSDASVTNAVLASGGWGLSGFEGDGAASRWASWDAADLNQVTPVGFMTPLTRLWGP